MSGKLQRQVQSAENWNRVRPAVLAASNFANGESRTRRYILNRSGYICNL